MPNMTSDNDRMEVRRKWDPLIPRTSLPTMEILRLVYSIYEIAGLIRAIADLSS